jgi:hypothetical protein
MAAPFTRESLAALAARELKELGKQYRVKGYGRMRKDALVKALLEAAKAVPQATAKAAPAEPQAAAPAPAPQPRPAKAAPAKPEADPETRQSYERRAAAAKYAVQRPVEELRREENLGELPASYDVNLLTLLPVSPERAYAYWDLSMRELGEHFQGLTAARPVLRLFRSREMGGSFTRVLEQDVDLGARAHYFTTEGGSFYFAELGIAGTNGYHRILGSNIVSTPAARVSERTEASFVNVPLDQPLPGAGATPAGGPAGGKVLSREEYEATFGQGVEGLPYTRRRRP